MADIPANTFFGGGGLSTPARPAPYPVDSKEFREEVVAAWPYFGPRQRAIVYSLLDRLLRDDPTIGGLLDELDGMDVLDRVLSRADALDFVPWDQAVAELDAIDP